MNLLNLPAGTQIITEQLVRDELKKQGLTKYNTIEIVFPESVIEISNFTINEFKRLSFIVIPEKVKKIGNFAFFGCISLTSLKIPENVTEIGEHAFHGCKSLTTVTLHDGVTKIGRSAFSRCQSLTSIVIPGSVTEIDENAFERCINLKTIYVSDMLADKGKDYWAQKGIDMDSVTLIRYSEIKTWVKKQGLFMSYNNHNQVALYDWCQHHINPKQLPDIAFKIPYADILMLRSYHNDVLLPKIPEPLERLDHNTCSRLSFFRRSAIPPKLLELLTVREIYNLFKAHVYDKDENSPEKVEILEEISSCNVLCHRNEFCHSGYGRYP